ncbi:MAG TPA: YciI family protein [Burkholderiaceae bacterium]|nr:YciI family protein [Burkholderiaceae bacterium]
MKFLCLIYAEEAAVQRLPAREADALYEECLGLCDELEAQGRLLASEKLAGVDTATTLRIRQGKVSITDGPFAETKEQLAGFYLIEAAGLHEALHIAARIPPARVGSIEVRPVLDLHGERPRAERPTEAHSV